MELVAFRDVFGPRPIPTNSVKGAIGHTLGAAGGIEAAIGLLALRHRTLPPTAGFREPEDGAEGRVSAAPQPIDGDLLLTTNSGFGGVNAALVLSRGEA
jgi:3-oxoacyl-[acyl-carrier-protein] synthase II